MQYDGSLLNYEGQAVYNLIVTVSDGEFSDTASVTINLSNVNEAPSAADASFSIPENSANGSPVGQVLASDPDNNISSYSISSGDPSGAFAIDSMGNITVANGSLLDYEGQAVYNLVVTVSDGEFSDTASVTINLSNVNEAP